MRSVEFRRCTGRQPFSLSLVDLDPAQVCGPELLRNVRKYLASTLTTLTRAEKPTFELADILWCFLDRKGAMLMIQSIRPAWLVEDCDCGREECFRIVLANGQRPYASRV